MGKDATFLPATPRMGFAFSHEEEVSDTYSLVRGAGRQSATTLLRRCSLPL
jgi:hypothetical protein